MKRLPFLSKNKKDRTDSGKSRKRKGKPAPVIAVGVLVPPGTQLPAAFPCSASVGTFSDHSPPGTERTTLYSVLALERKTADSQSTQSNILLSIKPSFTYIKHPTLPSLKPRTTLNE